jgi:hypothetical protein
MAGGLFNFEVGHYHSKDDKEGDNNLVPNSEIRSMVGFEREAAKNLTASFQYYMEQMLDYDQYRSTHQMGTPKSKYRQMLTAKLYYQMMKQTLNATAMLFYSPTDRDGQLRLGLEYKYSDQWRMDMGTNQFFGDKQDTFWNQFEDNSNFYAGLRYNF